MKNESRTAGAGWSAFTWALLAAVLLGVATPSPAGSATAREHPALTLVDRAELEMRSDPEASRRDAQSALELLKRGPDPDLEIRAHLVLCDYQSERDSAVAEQEIAAATALLPRATRPGLRAGVLVCEGQILETAADNAKAMVRYQQAVAIATREHEDQILGEALFSRGYLLGVQGDYATGLVELRRAQALFEKLNKRFHALTTLNAIAILYNRMGDYAEARHIYTSALKAQREAGMPREQAVTLHNLGRANENLRDWDAARRAFTESLEICRQINYPRGEAYALRGLGAVANASGEPQVALDTLARAEALQRQTPDARLGAQIQLARGIALHKLQRFPESTAALEEAVQIFRQADALSELNATYSELAAVYAESGNWHAAYDRQTDAKVTSDKLLQNQLDQRFATLKVEFDTAAKEKENAALLRENEANERALAQAQRLRRLQGTVIALTVLIAVLLAMFAVSQYRSRRRMHVLAMTDELTGVPNRRAVLASLEPLLRPESEAACSILVIDIDHFKTINDHHGHPAGDVVLKDVAEKIRDTVREPGLFGRLGGEEFLIVLPQTGLDEARRIAERFRQCIECIDTSRWFEDRRPITASIGVAVSMPGQDTVSTLLRRADGALYAAKRGGRNCVKTHPETTPQEDALVTY